MVSEAISDNERDATPPDDSSTDRPFDSRFVPSALDFLLECCPSMTLQQVRVVDQIIDRAVTEARELLREEYSNTEKLQEGDDRLGDLLVVAFQCAASHLDRMEKHSSDAHQLPSRCSQVIDTLCAISMKDGEPVDQQMLWQELLCHRWDEVAAGLALELLLLRAQLDLDCGNDNWMNILQVVSSTYAQFPVELKRFCMDQVSALVTTFIDEGPAYQFTPRMQLQLELLKYLATVDFLDNSDDLDIGQWLGDYFPKCFACCGVVLQLLDDWEQDGVGMLRMLDMGLLVFETVLGTFAAKRDDTRTLFKILTPTIIAALTQLTSRPAISNEPSAGKILSSCLKTSLYLLAKVVPVIEEGECDAMMRIFEKLLAPSSASNSNTRPALLSGCFDAIHQILVHSSRLTKIMSPPLIKLLEGGDLNVLYVQYTSQQAHAVDNNSGDFSNCACSESDIETEKAAPIASLLTGMGLDDTEASDEFTAQDPVELSTCSDVSVLRPDAPQWFDEEDSDDDTNERKKSSSLLQNIVDDHTTSGIVCIASTTTIPQWFGDTDDEDEEGIELP